MSISINWISVAADSEMFDGVQTSQRIRAFHPIRRRLPHHIDLMEAHVFNEGVLRTDIDDLYLAEYRETSNETVEARTDIKVALWFRL